MKHVLQVVGKMNIGGAEQLIMNVYRNIDRSKVQFDFLTFYRKDENGYFDEEINALGGKIIKVHKPSILYPIRSIGEVRKVLKTRKYDVVHTHIGCNSAFSLVAAKIEKTPIRVAHSHSTSKTNRTWIEKTYNSFLNAIVNFSLTKCVACSEAAAKCRFTKRRIANNYTYVPNAIDYSPYLQEYDTAKLREEIGVSENELFVLQVGNIKEAKNQLFSVEIAREYCNKHNNAIFVMAGSTDGGYAEKVRKEISRLGLDERVRLLGQRTDIPELMGAADVMIMPSLWEGLGIVLIEAQASGLPCVISNNIPKEADLGMGLIKCCSLDNLSGWVSYIEMVTNEKMDADSRERYFLESEYSLQKTISCFMKLYEIG